MKNIIKIISLLIILICLIIFSPEIMISIDFSLNVFKASIFPSLFPFFVISKLLINYGFVEILSKNLSFFMTKFFKINPNCTFIFIMSLLSGFPSSARYTANLLDNNQINEQDANKIILFSHFSNPIFILNTLSMNFLKKPKIGFLILISHYIGNIVIGLFLRNYNISSSKNNIISKKPLKFGLALTSSIKESIESLLLILGTMTTFIVFTTIIDNVLPLNSINQSILNGLLEITQGLKSVSALNIPLNIKAAICSFLLSFGSLSVHAQIISLVKIKYSNYFFSRVFHGLISSLITFLLV